MFQLRSKLKLLGGGVGRSLERTLITPSTATAATTASSTSSFTQHHTRVQVQSSNACLGMPRRGMAFVADPNMHLNHLDHVHEKDGIPQEVVVSSSSLSFRELILNRPKALNALNLEMVRELTSRIQVAEMSPLVTSVLIRGAGNKSFCAGGDVVALHNAGKSGRVGEALKFFREEYRLNYLISKTSRNYIAWLNGITMGGGVGLSVHGRTRIATENSFFAMPETAIGFFPDVGGSHFLSRMPNELGTYLALTGARLKGSDLVHAGIANHYAPSHSYVNLINKLNDNHQRSVAVNVALSSVTIPFDDLPEFSLKRHLPTIARCFAYDSVEEIVEALKAETQDVEFAKQTLKTLSHMSPLSLKVTLMQLRLGATQDLAECLKVEYRMASHFMHDSDFYEGVNKMLINKDRSKRPSWKHSKLTSVTDKEVERFFTAPYQSEELELESVIPLARGKPYEDIIMKGPFVKNIPEHRIVGENPYPLWEPLSTQYEDNIYDFGGSRGPNPTKASSWDGFVPARLDTGTPALASWKRIFEMRYWSYLLRHRNSQFEGYKGHAFEKNFAESTLRDLLRKTLGVAVRKIEQRKADEFNPIAQKLIVDATEARGGDKAKVESEILKSYGIVDGKFVLKSEYEKSISESTNNIVAAIDAKSDELMKKSLPGGLSPDKLEEIKAIAAAQAIAGNKKLNDIDMEAVKHGLMSTAENEAITERSLDSDSGFVAALSEADRERVQKAEERAVASAVENAKNVTPSSASSSSSSVTDVAFTESIVASVSGTGKSANGLIGTGLLPEHKQLIQSDASEFQAALRAFVDASAACEDPQVQAYDSLPDSEKTQIKLKFVGLNTKLCIEDFEKLGYISRDWLVLLERAADENPVTDPLLARLYTVHQSLLKATVKDSFKPEGLDAPMYADQAQYIEVLGEQIKMLIQAIIPYTPMPKSQLAKHMRSDASVDLGGATQAEAILLAQVSDKKQDAVAVRIAAAEKLAKVVGIPMPDFVKKGLELEQQIRAAADNKDYAKVQDLQSEMRQINWNPQASLSIAEETRAALAAVTEKKTPDQFDLEFDALMGTSALQQPLEYVDENRVLFDEFLKEFEKKSVSELVKHIEDALDKPNMFSTGELAQLAPVLEAAREFEGEVAKGTQGPGTMLPINKPHPEVSPLDALRMFALQLKERAKLDAWSQEDDADAFPDEPPTPERFMLKSNEQLAAEEFQKFLGLGIATSEQDTDYFLHRPKYEDVRPPEWPTIAHPDEFTFESVIATPCVPPALVGNEKEITGNLSLTWDEIEKMHEDRAYILAVRQDRIFERFLKISEHCAEDDIARLGDLYSRAQNMVSRTIENLNFKPERLTSEVIDANTPNAKTIFKSSRSKIDKVNAEIKSDLLKIAEDEKAREREAEQLSEEIRAFEEEMFAKPKQSRPVMTKDDLMDALTIESALGFKESPDSASPFLADEDELRKARSTNDLLKSADETAKDVEALYKVDLKSTSRWHETYTMPREPSLQEPYFAENSEKPTRNHQQSHNRHAKRA